MQNKDDLVDRLAQDAALKEAAAEEDPFPDDDEYVYVETKDAPLDTIEINGVKFLKGSLRLGSRAARRGYRNKRRRGRTGRY